MSRGLRLLPGHTCAVEASLGESTWLLFRGCSQSDVFLGLSTSSPFFTLHLVVISSVALL